MELRQHWEEHIKKQNQSGLSVASYCEREGLIAHQFGYWKKRIRKAERGNFLPVVRNESLIELEFPNGVKVKLKNAKSAEIAELKAALLC